MKSFFKYNIRLFITYGLFYSGLFFIYRHFFIRNKLTVLMYHRVISDKDLPFTFSNPGIVISESIFKKQLDFLNKWYQIISIEDAISHINNNIPFKGFPCLITFDDGWKDNITNAMPLLHQKLIPAVIFIPTDYIGSKIGFWQEHLSCLIHTLLSDRDNNHDLFLEKHSLLELRSKSEIDTRYNIFSLIVRMKELPRDDIKHFITSIETYLTSKGISIRSNELDNFMNWNDLKLILNSNISIGSHAQSHQIMTRLTPHLVEKEFNESKTILESELETSVQTIAYPNGNFNQSMLEEARKSGYKLGFSTMCGYHTLNDNPYCVKRINIHSGATDLIPSFMARLLNIL